VPWLPAMHSDIGTETPTFGSIGIPPPPKPPTPPTSPDEPEPIPRKASGHFGTSNLTVTAAGGHYKASSGETPTPQPAVPEPLPPSSSFGGSGP